MRAADLDAVTVDAYGTLVTLVDPVPELTAVLAARGADRDRGAVVRAFHAEVAHYVQNSASGHDEEGLVHLQRECARVFLDAVGADLDAGEFAPVYAGAMRFERVPGVIETLERLRSLGLELAVAANWDLTLRRRLEEVELAGYFRAIVHAAAKPAPDGLVQALATLGVDPSRALHIGDDKVDELAARAAGMSFVPAPLADAVARLS